MSESKSCIVLGIEVVGHVLPEGTRVVEAIALEQVLAAMLQPNAAKRVDLLELQRFSDWRRSA